MRVYMRRLENSAAVLRVHNEGSRESFWGIGAVLLGSAQLLNGRAAEPQASGFVVEDRG